MKKLLFFLLLLFSLLQAEEQPLYAAVRTIDSAGFLGSTLTLDDGSVWTVKSSDRALFRDWRDQQLREVVIIPNEGWILETGYPFCLVNLVTDEAIEVALDQPPEGDKSSFITLVDSYNSLLEIVDPSGHVTIWHVSRWDRGALLEWQAGDTVIIGGNVRWNKSYNPYILFNIKREEYVRGMVYLQKER